jgi:hypothetical protein
VNGCSLHSPVAQPLRAVSSLRRGKEGRPHGLHRTVSFQLLRAWRVQSRGTSSCPRRTPTRPRSDRALGAP